MTATPDQVALAAQRACLYEVLAEKPGNVTPTHAFADMDHRDFLASALVIGDELARAGSRSVGATILSAIQATRRVVRPNTNLGIVLLLAPLARAALTAGERPLRVALADVLAALTVEDAALAFEAIRLAQPGGLNDAAQGDVNAGPPTMTLLTAMRWAAERDSIASEYTTDFATTFEYFLHAFEAAQTLALPERVVQTYLALLAKVPDTLIARKGGEAQAREVSQRAAAVIALGGMHSTAGRAAVSEFDAWLRRAGNRLNPGTTADLIAAGLFVWQLGMCSPGERQI